MKGTLGLKKGSVPFKNDLETTLVSTYVCPLCIALYTCKVYPFSISMLHSQEVYCSCQRTVLRESTHISSAVLR